MQIVKTNSLSVAISAFETLYYANATSGVPFISKLTVSSDVPLVDLTLKLRVMAAAGQISHNFELQIANLGVKTLEFSDLGISFDASKMFQVSDPQAGTIQVEVLAGEQLVGHCSWPIKILPANFWRAGDTDTRSAYQSLAAFSQPNHPSVRSLLDAAVGKLSSKGGAASLSGYQDPSTVEATVEAIYASIQDLKLTYSDPPASWSGGPGQKIRTVQEILDERVGTCLDTTMLFSSCLEQAGLNPIVFLIPGHAFVGYWTGAFSSEYEGDIPRMPSIQPIDSLVSAMDLGLIHLVETTGLTNSADFASAQLEAKSRLEAYGAYGSARSQSLGIDIIGCRRSDSPIDPLPARFVNSSGQVEIIEYRPPVVDLDMLRERFAQRDAISGNRVTLTVPPMIRKWLDSLLDLSLRNPLINFANKRTAVRVLIPTSSLGLVEDLLQNQKIFELTPAPTLTGSDGKRVPLSVDNERGEVPSVEKLENFLNANLASPQGSIATDIQDPESFIAKLRKTASASKSILQETGSNGLYLALGSLSWKVKQGDIDSPLVLIPVTVTPKNRGRAFQLTIEDSGVTPNFSLVEKLKIEHSVNLDGLANLATDQFGIDIDGTLKYVREQLIKEGLKDFKVNATATLGFFNFSSYRLWKDLLDNWKRFEQNPLVKHLVYTPGEAFDDPVKDAEAVDLDQLMAELPVSADGSQAQAIASALQGKTFVLQGPPGTGKSQTITNLLAKALDSGKRVLFVAEKRDALDVVKQRIDEAGLGAFSLDLHDKNSTTRAVKEQLSSVIDILIDPDKVGFNTAIQDYNAALTPLNSYRDQLHESGILGESVFSALEKYLSIPTEKQLPVPGEFIANATQEILHEATEATKSLSALGPNAGVGGTNPWSLSSRASVLGAEELDRLKEVLSILNSQLTVLQSSPNAMLYLEAAETLDQVQGLLALGAEPVSSATADYLGSAEASEQLLKIKHLSSALISAAADAEFDVTRVGKIDFDQMDNNYRVALSANFLMRGGKLGALAKQLNAQLGIEKKINKDNFPKYLELLPRLQELGRNYSAELYRIPGLSLTTDPNPFVVTDRALVSDKLQQLQNLDAFLKSAPVEKPVAKSLLSDLGDSERHAAIGLVASLTELMKILEADEHGLARWKEGSSLGGCLLKKIGQLSQDAKEYGFSQLVRWTTLLVAAKPLMTSDLREALEQILTGKVRFDIATNAFLRGFYYGLFSNLMVQKGLNTFDGDSVNNYIRKLADAHEKLRARLPKILGAELLDRRGFDGSMKIGAIGDLVLSIKQGRSNISLKELLSKHWGVISKMTPCVLASPDSAVRFLSASSEPFDLVVFDEASQIRVANSIGALGRAKAAVVVGDSQQMPPTLVGVAKINVADEEESEVEESYGEPESILDQCETARVPEIMLSWHYRSEDESLIAFSNREYYDGRLSTFPTPNLGNGNRRLSLVNVNGQFLRSAKDGTTQAKGALRTNPVEAEAIVNDVIARLEDPQRENESIAIVALNEQQKTLVEALLAQSKNKSLQNALEDGVGGEEILIKALEKVQGSERDVVLVSVAFSAKREDRANLPLNFGPIMYQGGHRRLNVAITRARKEVKIFCSFEPKVLQDREPASRGLIDLAKFMLMANASSDEIKDKLAIIEKRQDWHRTDVAQALRAAGLEVIEEVGLSDFKVDLAVMDSASPQKAVLGILLDGRRWSQRPTVTDRDALPMSMLINRMGWSGVERIWLPNWLRNSQAEVNRIKQAFETAKKVGPKVSRKSLEVRAAEPIFTRKSELSDQDNFQGYNPVDKLLETVSTWRPLRPQVIGSQEHLDYLHDSQIKDAVREIVEKLTTQEGPVSSERLAKFVAACFGFNRVVAGRILSINGVGYPGHARDDEGFLFPKSVSPEAYLDWRKSDPESGRALQDVSMQEIINAMKSVALAAQGVAPEQLVKETSRVFGVQKVSKVIATRIEASLALAVESGQLVQAEGYLKPTE